MYYTETSGSYYEMGRLLGEAHQLKIGAMLDFLAGPFRCWTAAEFRRARTRLMAGTERRYPEIIEEIQGIADGSGFTLQQIYTMNFYCLINRPVMGCTDIVFPDTDDGPLLSKTNDMPVCEGKHAGVRLLRPTGGISILGGAFPGTCWIEPGMNEAGLAIGAASCSAETPVSEDVFSPHLLGRRILSKCENVPDALALLGTIPLGRWGMNLALVDRQGRAAVVEKSGRIQGVRTAAPKKPVYCTDHSCLTKEMQPYCGGKTAGASNPRYQTIRRMLRGRTTTRALLKKIVAYNQPPGALSRYGGEDPQKYETEFVAIFRVRSLQAEFCFSHPDRDPWREFSLRPGRKGGRAAV
ncbi:MAG TPA: C45 family autoproteolytic acyltransferase/hydrolase [Terrimicrobiaceae bacterium]|nr:C45 family autoproteolytic acyltransferase/hydrolase [Terrimicrobiaceae bacterium]